MNHIQPIVAGILLLISQGCVASLGGVLTTLQVTEVQRAQREMVAVAFEQHEPDAVVVDVVRKARKDYLEVPIDAGLIARTLTSPTQEQFVALFVNPVSDVDAGHRYSAYTVRGEKYRGVWVLERILEAERDPQMLNSAIEDYTLYVIARIGWFQTKITERRAAEFWDDSPLFEKIPAETTPPGYEKFVGQHRFVADAVKHAIAKRERKRPPPPAPPKAS